MRIAVAAVGKEEGSEISNQGARAPYYLIFDENGKLLETLSNPFSIGGGGAGFAVAKMLADKNIDVIIAGNFGPNMIGALDEKNIKHIAMTGSAREAVMKASKEV